MNAKNSKNQFTCKQMITKLIPILIHFILLILIKSNPSIDQHIGQIWLDPAFELLGLLIEWIIKKIK